MTVEAFIDRLSAVRLPDVFNPYCDRCPVYDKTEAPAIRRHNLALALAAASASGAETIWFGRDLGWRGGRRTGLPLTDEVRLPLAARAFAAPGIAPATRSGPMAEATASAVWTVIEGLQAAGIPPPMLWNVFPLHRHPPQVPLANRPHTAQEARLGAEIAAALIAWLRPRRLVALGGAARQALCRLGAENATVRHPAHGGRARFADDVLRLYQLAR